MHTTDPKIIDEATTIIRKYDAEKYVQSLQKKLMEEAWADVNRVKLEKGPKEMLVAMADFLINRAV